MSEAAQAREPSHIVLVVGVDLSEVSEHLLAMTRRLVRPIDEVDLHLVHVVHHDSISRRIAKPLRSPEIGASAQSLCAQWELQRISGEIAREVRAHVVIHTPIGDPVHELARIAGEVGADLVVVEAHDRTGERGLFHRSHVARLVRTAPCSVLTLRDPRRRPHRDAGRTVRAA